MGRSVLIFAVAGVAVLGVMAGPAGAATAGTSRVSVGNGGQQGDNISYGSAISGNGRFVAFTSSASNLVAGDTNGRQDVFVRDRTAGSTVRVSVSSQGTAGTGDSVQPAITPDGRYVVFSSDSAELVSGDLSGQFDIFVRDTVARTTRRLSVGPGGAEADGGSSDPVISPDGKFVAFVSTADNLVADDTNGVADVFVVTTATGAIARASLGSGGQANDASFSVAMSSDGRFVAFSTRAGNLVSYDPGGFADVFVRDMLHKVTRRMSQNDAGTPGNDESGLNYVAISADARYVAFGSAAANLVPGDTNGKWDVFVRDRSAGTTRRVSVGAGGAQGNQDSGFLFRVAISGNGRYIAYSSFASNLIGGDTNNHFDVFVRDTIAGSTARVSLTNAGKQADSASTDPAVSADGRHIAFTSVATDLVSGDTNSVSDLFVRDNF